MHLLPRHADIIERAKTKGRVSVDELAVLFDVTPQTIRKDLNEICDRRLLTRIHGGAVYPTGTVNTEYDQRRLIAANEKRAIGEAAADLIPNDASLFMNIGTTVEAVSEAITKHTGLMVITNNLNVANRLCRYPQIEVVVAGGIVRDTDAGIVGEATVDFITQFKVDFAVIGTSAIDEEGVLLDFDFREVKVTRAIINNARHVVLVSDATKFDRSAPIRIAHLSQIHTFVTDHCDSAAIRQICDESDVRIIETSRSAH
jgi:DeoR family glycerol-3-phosphate regulon repressor